MHQQKQPRPQRRPDHRTALLTALILAGGVLWSIDAAAFCGFFVGRADSSLFNNSSQVVLVHDEGKTVLTMVNNYRGEPRAFALVVPVPVVLQKELVRVADKKVVDRLDAFSAPRLAEYFDPNPCAIRRGRTLSRAATRAAPQKSGAARSDAQAFGVTVEAAYSVGEYDIVILSALESNGLEAWLRANKYNIPIGASQALSPYIKTGMKFFVAKVNLERQEKSGFTTLRPLQFAFPDQRFMLPIRLGMINADGPQDLIAYVITRRYRVEVANYVNPRLPTDVDIPTFVKTDFKSFYRDMFTTQVEKENGRAVFLEHAWNMSWCDPCAADPLTSKELEQLGVWWLSGRDGDNRHLKSSKVGAQEAYVTRLHARYTATTFPEDLMLKVTRDASNFQARYVLRHPFTGNVSCDGIDRYREQVRDRRETEISTLANLTGWNRAEIRKRMLPLPAIFSVKEPKEDPGWTDRMKEIFRTE